MATNGARISSCVNHFGCQSLKASLDPQVGCFAHDGVMQSAEKGRKAGDYERGRFSDAAECGGVVGDQYELAQLLDLLYSDRVILTVGFFGVTEPVRLVLHLGYETSRAGGEGIAVEFDRS